MIPETSDWNTAYKLSPYHEQKPHAAIIALDEYLRNNKVQRILDLGCGDGRHLVFLAHHGYNPYGLDNAPWGLLRAREWLTKEALPTNLVCGDMRKLPWLGEFFDGAIAIQVLHHNRIAAIHETLSEVRRVLRPDGILFATIAKYPPGQWKNGQYVDIEPHTFTPVEGFEQGIPHHFFTEEELREALSHFNILDLYEDAPRHYRVLVQRKHRAS